MNSHAAETRIDMAVRHAFYRLSSAPRISALVHHVCVLAANVLILQHLTPCFVALTYLYTLLVWTLGHHRIMGRSLGAPS